jgi:WD40 repeat protein
LEAYLTAAYLFSDLQSCTYYLNLVTINHPVWGNDIAFTQDGAYALISERDQSQIDVIDTSTFSVVKSIPTSMTPGVFSVHPFLPLVYVSGGYCCWGGSVMVIDTTTFTIQAEIPFSDDITSVIISPDGKWVYAGTYNGWPGIIRIDTATNTVDATLDIQGIYGFDISADGSRLYASTGWGNSVDVIDTSGFSVLYSLMTDGRTFNIALTCDNSGLYVADHTNPLKVFDTQTYDVAFRIEIPSSESGNITICAPGSSVHKFSSFTLNTLQINFGNKVKTDSFFIGGSFVLDPASKGFDPTLDAVTVQLGKITAKLSPGSFVKKGQKFVFQGNIGGITYMEISQKHSGYDFNLQAQNLNLTDKFTNQVTFNLTIGKNTGSIKTRLQGSLNLAK